MSTFAKGDLVEFTGIPNKQLPARTVGMVQDVDQRTVSVDFGPYGEWLLADDCLRVTPNGAMKDRAASCLPSFGLTKTQSRK